MRWCTAHFWHPSACSTQQAGTSMSLGAPVSWFRARQDSWKEVARYRSPWIELSPSASTAQSLFQFLLVFKGVIIWADTQTQTDCRSRQRLPHHPSKQRWWKPPNSKLSKTLRRKLCWSTDLTFIAVQSQISLPATGKDPFIYPTRKISAG